MGHGKTSGHGSVHSGERLRRQSGLEEPHTRGSPDRELHGRRRARSQSAERGRMSNRSMDGGAHNKRIDSQESIDAYLDVEEDDYRVKRDNRKRGHDDKKRRPERTNRTSADSSIRHRSRSHERDYRHSHSPEHHHRRSNSPEHNHRRNSREHGHRQSLSPERHHRSNSREHGHRRSHSPERHHRSNSREHGHRRSHSPERHHQCPSSDLSHKGSARPQNENNSSEQQPLVKDRPPAIPGDEDSLKGIGQDNGMERGKLLSFLSSIPTFPPPPPLPAKPSFPPSGDTLPDGDLPGPTKSTSILASKLEALSSTEGVGSAQDDRAAAKAGGSSAVVSNSSGKKRLLLSFGDEIEDDLEEGSKGLASKAFKLRGSAPPLASGPPSSASWSLDRSLDRANIGSALNPLYGLMKGALGGNTSSSPVMGRDLVGRAPGLRQAMSSQLSSPLSSDYLGGGDRRGSWEGEPSISSPSAGSGVGGLGRAVFGVARARNQRPYMEDRHSLVQCLKPLSASGQPLAAADGVERSWAAVFDGHNGSRAAEEAAARLHTVFASDPALRLHGGGGGPPAAVAAEVEAISASFKRAFRQIDDEILTQSRKEGTRDGSTALVVVRLGDALYCAHAGDSRAVLCRRGGAMRLTQDHKPDLPSEKARILAAGGRVEFQRCWRVCIDARDGRPGSGLAVSRSLGDLDFKEPKRFVEGDPEVHRTALSPGGLDSFVVLASDGLYDVLDDNDVIECASKILKVPKGGGLPAFSSQTQAGELATSAAEALLQLSVARGTMDNVTVIVMLL